MMELLGYPAWVVMWGLAITIFFVCKFMSLCGVHAPWWRKWLYVVAWPGMNAAACCRGSLRDPALVRGANHDTDQTPTTPSLNELMFSLAKTTIGLDLLFVVVPMIEALLLRGWLGMVGVVFTLHFGLFHVLSWCWRRIGVDAKPLMVWPILATSLSDFWGRRWNTAFRDLTHRFLFRTLAVRLGATSGLAVWLYHPPFVFNVNVIVPFLDWLHAPALAVNSS